MIGLIREGAKFLRGGQMGQFVQLLVFRLDERLYALRLTQVDRVIRAVDAMPLPQAPPIVLGAIDLQGRIVPLLNIRKRFGVEERDVGIEDHFIIANTSQRTVALAVDSVSEVVERLSEQIVAAQKILGKLDQIEGVIQLDDGLTLIHDLERFLSLDEQHLLDEALTMESSHGR
jgi:purine-binding chemotaxis protein CheW